MAVSGTTQDRVIEYVDHLHEHFLDPAVVTGGRYVAPAKPGFSAQLHPDSIATHLFPSGAVWSVGQ